MGVSTESRGRTTFFFLLLCYIGADRVDKRILETFQSLQLQRHSPWFSFSSGINTRNQRTTSAKQQQGFSHRESISVSQEWKTCSLPAQAGRCCCCCRPLCVSRRGRISQHREEGGGGGFPPVENQTHPSSTSSHKQSLLPRNWRRKSSSWRRLWLPSSNGFLSHPLPDTAPSMVVGGWGGGGGGHE